MNVKRNAIDGALFQKQIHYKKISKYLVKKLFIRGGNKVKTR